MYKGFKILPEWEAWLREDPNRMLYLEPGFAGELDGAELAFIKAHLRANPELRRRWGLRRRFNDDEVKDVAMHGRPVG